jgi:predicted transcriptional regulator of viral defense system
MDFAEAIKNYQGQPLTRQILMDLLQEYRRPYDKINDLVKKKVLQQVKRGVFIPGPKASIPAPENLLMANHLWGPSYVSTDSALSYWGMIPERVYETCSMTTNLAKTYKTPVGRFRYIKLPLPYYSFGIQRVEVSANQMVLIAGKEKALCDKIITTQRLKLRSVKQTREYLMEDLRISRDTLRELDTRFINDYIKESPKQESISILIKTLNDL